MSTNSPRQRALVVAQDPQLRATLERVIRAASFDVDAPATTDEAQGVQPEDFALLVVGTSSLHGKLAERLQAMRARTGPMPEGRIVVIDESPDRRTALETICAQRADYLVPHGAVEDILLPTVSKLFHEDYFGLEKYLAPGAQVQGWTLTSSDDKRSVIDHVEEVASDASCHPRVIDLLVSALDEMVINALYRPEPGRPESDVGRPQGAGRKVTVRCGADARFLGVSVADEYGLFRPDDLFRGLATALQREHDGLPSGASRASLGFRLMLTTLSHLVIDVDPGRCTEIIGLVDLRKSLAEYRAAVPSLGMFVRERV